MSDEEVTTKQIEDLYFDQAFQKLIKSTERFNMFRIMRVDKKERVHSEILSYLLDPGNNHFLEKRFLKKFLVLLKNNEGIGFDDYLSMIKENPRIETEKYLDLKNIIDIFVEFSSLVIGIENKVKAGEGVGQLKKYQQEMKKKYLGKNKLLVFLTPSGREPNSSEAEIGVKVISISYEDIKDICEDIKDNAQSNVKMFLNNFIIHLEEDIMGSSNEIIELCQDIHENHPDAYRYMVEHHQTIINNKIIRLFEKLKDEINEINEPGLIVDDYEVVKKQSGSLITSIKIRNEKWPEGFFIRIYKHSRFGIYPYVEKDKLDDKSKKVIKNIFYDVGKISSPYETKKYNKEECYFTKEYVGSTNDYRAIEKNGDQMTEEDTEKAKKKLEKLYNEINPKILKLKEKL